MSQSFDQLLILLADQHRREIDALQTQVQQLQGKGLVNSSISHSSSLSSKNFLATSVELPGALRAHEQLRVPDPNTSLDRLSCIAACGDEPNLVDVETAPEDRVRDSMMDDQHVRRFPSNFSIVPSQSTPENTILPMVPKTSIQLPGAFPTDDEISTNRSGMLQPFYEDSVPAYLHDVLKEATISGKTLIQGNLEVSAARKYDVAVGVVILLNAVFIGWQVHHRSENDETLLVDYIFAGIFCLLFGGDLCYRILTQRCAFFDGRDRNWNVFDLCIVSLMVVEEFLRWVQGEDTFLQGVSILRTFRLLRFVRILQVVQTFQTFREFRLLLDTMLCGTRAMLWVVFIAVFISYVVGIALTEGSHELCSGDEAKSHDTKVLCDHFGKLGRSFLSIYEAVFAGVLWGELMDSLLQLNALYPVLFVLMISFVLIILANTVTAVVLRMVSEVAQGPEARIREEKEAIAQLTRIFNTLDPNRSGDVCLEELVSAFDSHELVGLFATLDIDVNDDAKRFFQMLDRDGTGVIPQKEFVLGCLRLKGAAKAADIVRLQQSVLEVRETVKAIKENIGDNITREASRSSLSDATRDASRNSIADMSPARKSTAVLQRAVSGTNAMKNAKKDMVEPVLVASGGTRIPKTEERAMSLKQMRRLGAEIKRRCVKEQWVDMKTGSLLQPEDVNLYHLNYNHICPLTTPDGVVLKGLKPRKFEKGQQIVQYNQDSYYALPIAEGVVRETSTGDKVQVTILRGIFLKPDASGKQNLPVFVNEADCGIPSGVASPNALSYKELVSSRPLAPKWFCCHWWGEKVCDFISCCESHTKFRGVDPDDASFWVCAYANCQHDLGADITIDPEHSSFRRAMRLAKGVLLVLDPDATPFRRIWCDFELYKTISIDKKPLDIVTIHDDQPRLLSEECLPHESAHYKSLREQKFPIRLLVEGMKRLLEDGDTSVELDKTRILGSMARDVPMTGSSNELSSHDARLDLALRRANNALHAYFALSAWSFAVNAGIVEDFDLSSPGSLSLAEVLSRDEERQRLTLSLAHSNQIVDTDLQVLAQGLPPNLLELFLSFDGCPLIRDAGLEVLAEGLPRGLRGFKLDMSNCKEITDVGVGKLMQGLPDTIEHLELYFANCPEIALESARMIIDKLPKSCVKLVVSLMGTTVNKSFESAAALRKFLVKSVAWKATVSVMGKFLPRSIAGNA